MSRFGCLSIITTYIFLSNNHLWSSSFKKYHHFSVFSVFIFSPILTYWAISQLLGSVEKSHITNLFLYWPQLTFLRIKKFDVSPVYKSTEPTTVKRILACYKGGRVLQKNLQSCHETEPEIDFNISINAMLLLCMCTCNVSTTTYHLLSSINMHIFWWHVLLGFHLGIAYNQGQRCFIIKL